MCWWEVVNSRIVSTLIMLLWGSLVASWITALWQKRNHKHQIKHKYAQEVINTYQDYVRLVRGSPERLGSEDFDIIHSQLLSQAKIAGLLFKDKRIQQSWSLIVDKLSNVHALRIDGRDTSLVEKELKKVFAEADVVTEFMFRELS